MDPKASKANAILFRQEVEQWKADVGYCRNEIKVLNRYLQEVIEKNSASGRKEEITQFQHMLSEKIEISYELMSAIGLHDETLHAATEEDHENAQTTLKERVAEFCRAYSAFKSLFVRFLARADLIV